MKDQKIQDILTNANSFTRFGEFLNICTKLKGKQYWETLNKVYTCCDNLYSYKEYVRFVFLSDEPQREYLMSEEERGYLNNFPDNLVIYRGMTEMEFQSKSFGVSWSLKREVAEFFANKYERNFATKNLKKIVHEVTINKSEVIAYFHDRKECEVIYINK